jgi:hypothetical protein
MRMLYCPLRSPFKRSSRFPGKFASDCMSGAASRMSSFRRAERWIAWNRRTGSRRKRRSASEQRKDRITRSCYTASRYMSTSTKARCPCRRTRRRRAHRHDEAEPNARPHTEAAFSSLRATGGVFRRSTSNLRSRRNPGPGPSSVEKREPRGGRPGPGVALNFQAPMNGVVSVGILAFFTLRTRMHGCAVLPFRNLEL